MSSTTPLIPLPDDFVAQIISYTGQVFAAFSGTITLIIGALLGVLIIGALIEYIKHK